MNILEYENTQELKTHGNLDFPFNIYPCSIPLDFTSVPLHWHNDMEIIYIKKGRGLVSVDLAPYSVEAGDILFITPGCLHGIWESAPDSMEYENIIFQLSLLMGTSQELCTRQFFAPLLQGQKQLPVYIDSDSPLWAKVSGCLDKIDELSGYGDALSALGIKVCLFALFHMLFCNFPDSVPARHDPSSLETLKRILKHVETHYQEPLSIEHMASLCGFSCSHFMKFFKEAMGTSFTAYLNDYRLTLAARMLTASSETITVIAPEVGFDNLSYFNRIFKRKYGVTPSQYRNGINPD